VFGWLIIALDPLDWLGGRHRDGHPADTFARAA
jgi:hypothetical protein